MIIDKDNIKILLIILVVGLGIGYAYINSDLNINGTAQVNSANWDIHWANIQVDSGSVSASSPTISNQTTVNYSVILNTPGDYYEFTVDAINGGSIDAMIDTIDSKLNGATITTLPDYLNYTVTYGDGVELEQNHQLLHNTTEKYKVRVEYNTDINANQLPASNQTLNLEFTVTYRQANENAIEVNHSTTKYTANVYSLNAPNYNWLKIGTAIPSSITQYSSAAEALAALRISTGDDSIQFCLKHKIQEGIITESYIEFVITPAMVSANPGMTAGTYTIRGLLTKNSNSGECLTEYYDSTNDKCVSPYYESNKETLLSAFGNTYCGSELFFSNDAFFTCDATGVGATVYSYGTVHIGNNVWFANIDEQGTSCYDFY